MERCTLEGALVQGPWVPCKLALGLLVACKLVLGLLVACKLVGAVLPCKMASLASV